MQDKTTTFLIRPTLTLVTREILRFYRQPSRIVGALGTPLLFWLLIGSGLGQSFQVVGGTAGYLEYFFPGTVAMVVLFTSIFSTISLIEDRREGFLQSVLVAPVSRLSIVGGKVIGGTLLAAFQGALFLALPPFLGLSVTFGGFCMALGSIALLSLGLTSLSFLFAWKLNSVQGFHGVMNLVLFPMWLLSGAAFPLNGAPLWLRIAMVANPLTYGVALLRRSLYTQSSLEISGLPEVGVAFGLTLLFAVIFYLAGAFVVSVPSKESHV